MGLIEKKISAYHLCVQFEQYNPPKNSLTRDPDPSPAFSPAFSPTFCEDPGFLPAFQRGDEWVFLELARWFRTPILQYVRGRIGNSEVSEDVTQEIFLKIYRFRESYDPSFRFTSWLWTIARNATTDWGKKEKPHAFESQVEEFPCSKPNPERRLLQSGRKRMLRQAMTRLTTLQRRVVWLRVKHQLSCAEIADRMGISPSAVKCAMYRAKAAVTRI